MNDRRPLALLDPPAPGWARADFFAPDGDRLLCTLCPHACRLRDGETGFCRVRRRDGEELLTATFATAVVHLDAIERKPLYHFRPGSRALTLAPPGCTFTCHYCTNYRLSQFGRDGGADFAASPADPEALATEAARVGAALALSYTEPILAAELTLALAAAARPRGVPLVWKTNGFISPTALDRLAGCLAAVNLDLKAADDRKHRALTSAPLAPVLEAAAELVRRGVWVEVSTPVIPGFNDDEATLARMAEHVAGLGVEVPWHLLRFSPDFHMKKLSPTTPAALEAAVAIGRRVGLRFVYVERALGEAGRSTDCAACGNRLIRRDIWGMANVNLLAGACPGCGCVSARRVGGLTVAEYRIVPQLPDLIQPEEYADDPAGARVRVRLRVTEDGVEVLGDAARPAAIEKLLEELGAKVIDQMMCG